MTSAAITAVAASASPPWWVAPAVVAGLMAAAVTIITLMVNGRRSRIDRQRALFADAFGDIASYREYPYIVRRRRHDQPEAERARISAELSDLQARLNRDRAVLQVEAPRVGRAFAALLVTTRRIAGALIHEGWDLPPITSDADIHVDIDLSGISSFEGAFLVAQADHLALAPWWLRACGRIVRATPGRAWRWARGQAPILAGAAVEGSAG
jgi:hypothetical protein